MTDTTSAIVVAICAALPSTLTGIATLIYVIKNSAKMDGHLSTMTEIVKSAVETKASDVAVIAKEAALNVPRQGRKTD